MRRIPQELKQVKEIFCPETQRMNITGNFNNYIVRVNEFGIAFYGSMSKILFGSDTIKFVDRPNFKTAVNKLSDNLRIDVNNGKILRVDFGQNLFLDEKVEQYYPLLLAAPYLQRIRYLNTVYFRNKRKDLVFYDKGLETNNDKENIFRYELRLKRNPAILLKQDKLTIDLLYDQVVYTSLLNFWNMEYLKIQKARNSKPYPVFRNAKELKDALALMALANEELELLQRIETMQKQGSINKVTALRCRRLIQELQNGNRVVYTDNSLLEELDNKMKVAFESSLKNI